MEVEIRDLSKVLLAGKRIETSLAKNETSMLWRPFRQKIKDQRGLFPNNFFSISYYGEAMKNGTFTPETIFEKWAAIEIQDSIPEDFEELELEGGKYAVFEFAGSPIDFHSVMQEFYGKWLPKSGFELDTRPHFETFDETYDPFSDTSVESIWIPVISKK